MLHLAGYSIEAVLDLTYDFSQADEEYSIVFLELLTLYRDFHIGSNQKNTPEGDNVNGLNELRDSAGNTDDKVSDHNFVTADNVHDENKDVMDTSTDEEDDDILDGDEVEMKVKTEQAEDVTKSESSDSGNIAETTGLEDIPAVVDDIVEMFDKKTELDICENQVYETLDVETENEDSESGKDKELPVERAKYYKGNVQVSKETNYGASRVEVEMKHLSNFDKSKKEETLNHSSLDGNMEAKVKVQQETTSTPVICDKLKIRTLLYKPKIVKLNITEINYLIRKPDLGQLCLQKFLEVNNGLQKFAISWKGLTFDFFKVCLSYSITFFT